MRAKPMLLILVPVEVLRHTAGREQERRLNEIAAVILTLNLIVLPVSP